MKINKRNLLGLPKRDEGKESIYDSIYIVPTREKHESGFSIVAIIGRNFKKQLKEKLEIAAYCDDIFFKYKIPPKSDQQAFRIDADYPSGIIQVWSWYHKFKVEANPYSSTEIELVLKKVTR